MFLNDYDVASGKCGLNQLDLTPPQSVVCCVWGGLSLIKFIDATLLINWNKYAYRLSEWRGQTGLNRELGLGLGNVYLIYI